MKVIVRIQQSLIDKIRADLSRPHPFAAERVGFILGRLDDAGPELAVVLMTQYLSLADERYIDDPRSGARIDSGAIRGAMQAVLDNNQGAFHVHMHGWPGRPTLSRMDATEIPPVVTGLARAGPAHAHGIFLMHNVECAAWVWLSGATGPIMAQSVSVVGYPLLIFGRNDA
jgi:hypothetical protein